MCLAFFRLRKPGDNQFLLQAVSPGELAVNEGIKSKRVKYTLFNVTVRELYFAWHGDIDIAGDLVTVTDPDVGQGWCQATGPSGTMGVVPEVMWMFDQSYVVLAQLD